MIALAADIGGAHHHDRAELLLDGEVPALRYAQLEVPREGHADTWNNRFAGARVGEAEVGGGRFHASGPGIGG